MNRALLSLGMLLLALIVGYALIPPPIAAPSAESGAPIVTPEPALPTPVVTAVFTLTVSLTPTPATTVSWGAETTNLLLLGSDKRKEVDGTWRTDTMIVVAINSISNTVGVINIPRDLWVYVPTYSDETRINVVDFLGQRTDYPGGGPALLKETIQYNLGLPLDNYARLDFEGFKQVIDTLGGINVEVDCPIEDRFIDPDSPTGFKHMKVMSGTQHMDGELALMFVRSRRQGDDWDRARRQQRVLLAVRERVLQLDILPKIPDLWLSLKDSVETDLRLSDILYLAWFGSQIELEDIRGRTIDSSMACSWETPRGGQVLVPNGDKIHQALEGLFSSPPLIQSTSRDSCP